MSESELRRLLADVADLAPTTLDRPRPRPLTAARRPWRAIGAVVAAAASVTAVAFLASAAPWDTGAPASPGGSPQPTGASPTTGPTAAPYVGDGVLVVRPM